MIVLNNYINIKNITTLYILLLCSVSLLFIGFGVNLLDEKCIFNDIIYDNIFLQVAMSILLILLISLRLIMIKYYNEPYHYVNHSLIDYNSIQENLQFQQNNLINYNRSKRILTYVYYCVILISICYFLFMGLYIVSKFLRYDEDEINSCDKMLVKYVENQICTDIFIVITTAIMSICNFVC